jgi:hypothetical protein
MNLSAKQYTDRQALTKRDHDRLEAEMGRPVTSETPHKRTTTQAK